MKALVGQVPNLSWWRLQHMTDAEIQEFNGKYVREVEMSVKELKFAIDPIHNIIITFDNIELIIKSSDGDGYFAISRDEAHLLYLYLKEHLNAG